MTQYEACGMLFRFTSTQYSTFSVIRSECYNVSLQLTIYYTYFTRTVL